MSYLGRCTSGPFPEVFFHSDLLEIPFVNQYVTPGDSLRLPVRHPFRGFSQEIFVFIHGYLLVEESVHLASTSCLTLDSYGGLGQLRADHEDFRRLVNFYYDKYVREVEEAELQALLEIEGKA